MHQQAIGFLRLSLNDFLELTPYEFRAVVTGYKMRRDEEMDSALWHTRWLGAQIWNAGTFKLKKLMEPKNLFILPGEKKLRKKMKLPTEKEVRQMLENKRKKISS